MTKNARLGFLFFLVASVLLGAQAFAGTPELPQVKTYEELRHAISEARAGSRARVEKAVTQEKVREAWEIGRLIDAHVLQHKERADYGEKVLERLSADLGVSHTELKYMLQFYRSYPTGRPADQLSWSQYESLLAVNDPAERKTLAARAVKEKWTRDQMREEVKALTHKEKPAETNAAEKLTPPYMGQPGTYKIILAKAGPYQGELALDLGFSNYFRLSEITEDLGPFHEGDLVSFEDKEIQILGKPRGMDPESLLYTYKAWVLRVLDGDTIEAVIDLGFGITTTQTLRLRGIDCPELVSKEGKEAKEFVEKILIGDSVEGIGDRKTKTESVIASGAKQSQAETATASDELSKTRRAVLGAPATSIFIRTSKSDKYDRYLVDIFFTSKNGEDQYLNNLLLEKGLAVKVSE